MRRRTTCLPFLILILSAANSDRRPVDPPPVVELRIIEGDNVEDGRDITFDYNANFFLYASLEQARPMAHGRVQTPAVTNPPILTGVPVSGRAYLDRPSEAGYFIFPDLSVRHEGYYRLAFSLYETCKDEKDADRDSMDSNAPPGVDWRMEIKTKAFNVFSAKKFPGLMESTQLSKTVADQGCRVRIRRDVRMRKREGKGSGSSSAYRREEEYARREPQTPVDDRSTRGRSVSNSSEHRVPYPADSRRPSVDSFTAPPPPTFESAPAQPRSHLSFGDSTGPQYAAPRQFTAPSPAPLSQSAKASYMKAEASSHGYPSSRSTPQPLESPTSSEHKRQPSVPESPTVFSRSDGHSRRVSLTSYRNSSSRHSPETPQPSLTLPPLRLGSAAGGKIEAQTEPLPPIPMLITGGKRKHSFAFDENDKPLRDGQRQQDPHHRPGMLSPRENDPHYTRADGVEDEAIFNSYRM